MYNALLRRQLRKYLGSEEAGDAALNSLFGAVSASYDHFETDRRMIERSMDLSSAELVAANERLRRETERYQIVLVKLKESLAALEEDAGVEHRDDVHDELVAVADTLREQIQRRKEAEQKLAESEERFRLLAENSSDLIVRYDADGRCTYISPSSVPMLGYRPEELIGKTVFDVMHPADIRPTALALNRALHSDAPFAITSRIIRRDGTARWYETTIRALRESGTRELSEYQTAARDVTDRVEAEERLRATSSRLSTLIENLEAAVLVESDVRTIVLVNQNFCDMFGIPAPPAALIGMDCSNAAEQSKRLFADPDGFVERIAELLRNRRTAVGEQLAMADGRTLERDYIPIFVDGVYSGHMWHYRDITARIEAHEELRRTTSRLKTLVESLKGGVIVVDDRQYIAVINETFCRMFGIEAEPASLIGTDNTAVTAAAMEIVNDAESVIAWAMEVMSRGEAAAGKEVTTRDGRTIEYDYIPIYLDAAYGGHLWHCRDITERKRIEEAVRESEERYRLLAETASDTIITIDRHGEILFANGAAERVFGYLPQELVGQKLSMLMPERMRSKHEESMHLYEATNRRNMSKWESLELPGLHRDGHEVPLNVSFAEVRRNGSSFFTGIIRDDTERKRAEASIKQLNEELRETNEALLVERDREKEHVRALEEVNSMKSDFVSSVSHELRTPLASIIGFTQTMQLDPDLDAETRAEFLTIIHDEGNRLAKLINDLLDVGRIESGRMELDAHPENLVPIAERALTTAAIQASQKGIIIDKQITSSTIVATVDGSRIAQVIINLLDNAVKFTPRNGSVSLRMTADDSMVEIAVADSGMGIPAESIPRLFEKFYRVHRPGQEVRGTGLGLAIARQLIQMHGGTIDVESVVGQGSTFTVRLPRAGILS